MFDQTLRCPNGFGDCCRSHPRQVSTEWSYPKFSSVAYARSLFAKPPHLGHVKYLPACRAIVVLYSSNQWLWSGAFVSGTQGQRRTLPELTPLTRAHEFEAHVTIKHCPTIINCRVPFYVYSFRANLLPSGCNNLKAAFAYNLTYRGPYVLIILVGAQRKFREWLWPLLG